MIATLPYVSDDERRRAACELGQEHEVISAVRRGDKVRPVLFPEEKG